ncbi:MAG: protein kinase [Planctomycetes bacterium]|nr:protein kinase [Planctomycetota bacterium]
MKCPRCAFENPPAVKFCGECGGKLGTSAERSLVGDAPTGALPRKPAPSDQRQVGPTGPAALPRPGETLAGRFTVESALGHGGMGAVFKARDTKLDRAVALKLVLGMSPEALDRFQRESKIIARLEHRNIVPVHDVLETDFGPCLVMQFVAGENLLERIGRDGKLAPPEAVRIAREVCEALSYAHRKGIIHRDVKPSNVLLARTGEIKVADFGIARGMGLATMEQIGTAGYMAPEQEEGGIVDYRTDLYGVGAMLYHMLTGERPTKMRMDSLPPPLREVVDRATARSLEERYANAAELSAALAAALAAAREVVTAVIVREEPPRPPVVVHEPTVMKLCARCLLSHTDSPDGRIGKNSVFALLVLAGVVIGAASVRQEGLDSRDTGYGRGTYRILVWGDPIVRESANLEDIRKIRGVAGGVGGFFLSLFLVMIVCRAFFPWKPGGAGGRDMIGCLLVVLGAAGAALGAVEASVDGVSLAGAGAGALAGGFVHALLFPFVRLLTPRGAGRALDKATAGEFFRHLADERCFKCGSALAQISGPDDLLSYACACGHVNGIETIDHLSREHCKGCGAKWAYGDWRRKFESA